MPRSPALAWNRVTAQTIETIRKDTQVELGANCKFWDSLSSASVALAPRAAGVYLICAPGNRDFWSTRRPSVTELS